MATSLIILVVAAPTWAHARPACRCAPFDSPPSVRLLATPRLGNLIRAEVADVGAERRIKAALPKARIVQP